MQKAYHALPARAAQPLVLPLQVKRSVCLHQCSAWPDNKTQAGISRQESIAFPSAIDRKGSGEQFGRRSLVSITIFGHAAGVAEKAGTSGRTLEQVFLDILGVFCYLFIKEQKSIFLNQMAK